MADYCLLIIMAEATKAVGVSNFKYFNLVLKWATTWQFFVFVDDKTV